MQKSDLQISSILQLEFSLQKKSELQIPAKLQFVFLVQKSEMQISSNMHLGFLFKCEVCNLKIFNLD